MSLDAPRRRAPAGVWSNVGWPVFGLHTAYTDIQDKKERDSLVQRKVRGTGRGCSVSDLCRPWPLPSTVAGTWWSDTKRQNHPSSLDHAVVFWCLLKFIVSVLYKKFVMQMYKLLCFSPAFCFVQSVYVLDNHWAHTCKRIIQRIVWLTYLTVFTKHLYLLTRTMIRKGCNYSPLLMESIHKSPEKLNKSKKSLRCDLFLTLCIYIYRPWSQCFGGY